VIASKYSFRLVSPEIRKTQSAHIDVPPTVAGAQEPVNSAESDTKKRSFLKLAGVVGVGAAATMLIPKKAEALVFGSSPTTGVVGLKDSSNNRINPAKEDGNLATVAAQAGLMSFDAGSNPANLLVKIAAIAPGADIGIQNAANVTINPAQEDGNLATLTTTAGTISTNTTKLTSLSFDGNGNLLTATSGAASVVGLKDTTGTQINPASDDANTYLRRIVKLMESQAVVDAASRQRVNIDSFGTNTSLVTGTGASGAGIPRVTVSSDSGVVLQTGANAIGSLTAGAAVIGSLTNVATIAGQNQQMYQDVARNAYATGIRNNLAFS